MFEMRVDRFLKPLQPIGRNEILTFTTDMPPTSIGSKIILLAYKEDFNYANVRRNCRYADKN